MSLRARLAERGNLPPIVAVLVKCGTGRKREIEGRRAGRRGRHCRGGSIGVHLSLLRYRPACRCLYRVENALRKPAVVVDTGGRPGTRRKGVNHGTAQEIAALVAWVLGVWLVLADGCRLPPLGQQGRNPATTGVLPLTRVRKKQRSARRPELLPGGIAQAGLGDGRADSPVTIVKGGALGDATRFSHTAGS